jgi:alpha-D-ribose 1-methylphosphonate 5-triphosphate synthase subunit PhnH
VTETLLDPAELGAGARAAALRRTPRASQRDFTILLDALARPGTVGRLEVPAPVPPAALAAAGLADVEVPMCVLASAGEGEAWAGALHAATGAPRAAAAVARTVVALRPVEPAEIDALPRGDVFDPELGARLFAAVDRLVAGADEVTLRLSGPGVPDERVLGVAGLPAAVFDALARANSGFPLGVDTFLVAADGSVAGLPRTTRLRVGTPAGTKER